MAPCCPIGYTADFAVRAQASGIGAGRRWGRACRRIVRVQEVVLALAGIACGTADCGIRAKTGSGASIRPISGASQPLAGRDLPVRLPGARDQQGHHHVGDPSAARAGPLAAQSCTDCERRARAACRDSRMATLDHFRGFPSKWIRYRRRAPARPVTSGQSAHLMPEDKSPLSQEFESEGRKTDPPRKPAGQGRWQSGEPASRRSHTWLRPCAMTADWSPTSSSQPSTSAA